MAAAIPEIAGTAATAGRTAAGAGEIKASRIPARERPPFGPEPEGPRRAGGGARGARTLPAVSQRRREGTEPRGGQRRERQFSQSAKRTGKGALRARLPGSHSYQPAILAEFLVAVVIVSVSPVAKGGSPESKAKGSPSPYSTNTLKQLVAIGGVYFVLALLASSRRAGRYAAWFGGLVLLGLGFAELASGDLKAVFKIFSPGSSAGGAAAGGAPGAGGTAPGWSLVSPGTIAGFGQSPFATPSLQDAGAGGLVLEPGGTLVPSLIDSGQTSTGTRSDITVQQGGTGVITSGPGPGVNLA